MNIYIVEDEFLQLEDLKISIENLGHIVVGSSDDPLTTLDEINQLNTHVALIDIHLNKKEAGILLAKKIKELYNIPIIFITSEISDTVIEKAVSIKPLAYLPKPVNENNLKASLILVESILSSLTNEEVLITELFTRNGNKLHKIEVSTILYIHTDSKNYCSIITTDEKKFSVRNSISGLLKILNTKVFIQTHRSFLINWNYVQSFSENDQSIRVGDKDIPVGRTFKHEIVKRLRIV